VLNFQQMIISMNITNKQNKHYKLRPSDRKEERRISSAGMCVESGRIEGNLTEDSKIILIFTEQYYTI
jgi:hypothetical protein